ARKQASSAPATSNAREGLIAPTVYLQEWVLHILDPRSGVLCGWDHYPCILLPPNLFSRNLHGPHLCPCVIDGPNVSMLLHGPHLGRCIIIDGPNVSGILHEPEQRSGISRSLCRGILNGLLYGADLCLRIFLGRPRFEFPKQGFR